MAASLLQQIKKARADLRKKLGTDRKIHLEIEDNGEITFNLNDNTSRIYKPTEFFQKYNIGKKHVNLVMGPYSSGKSVGIIMQKLVNATKMPPCKDGIRRCRTLMSRTTYPELTNSVIKTFKSWFKEFGEPVPGKIKTFTEKPPVYFARFNDCHGTIEWEVDFLAFESKDDEDKLGSIEFTDAFINELREFPKEIFDMIQGRIGRFPMIEDLGTDDYPRALDCDTNPPTDTHWIKPTFDSSAKPEIFTFWRQKPAVIKNSDGKWIENPYKENPYNSKDYYINFIAGKTEEFIKVYACGDYGIACAGNPVFPEYNDDWHSVDNIEFTSGAPLYLGWDFGLTPCLLVSQFINGQLRVITELVTESFGIENLLFERVKPFWQQAGLKDYVIRSSVADPAGDARSAKNINEPTLIQIISKNFTLTKAAITNKEEPRLQAVRSMLGRNVNGKPMLLISRKGCPILREGFNGKYYTKEVTVPGKLEKMITGTPVKYHPHSEPQDCLQYIALEVFGTGIKEISESAKRIQDQIGAPNIVRL